MTRSLVLKVIKYIENNKDFYFPFKIICSDFKKDNSFYEVNCLNIGYKYVYENNLLLNFNLEENLQTIDEETTKLMVKGFIDKILHTDIENKIMELASEYRKTWKEELWESERIEEYGFNEFVGGKAEAYEDCLRMIQNL